MPLLRTAVQGLPHSACATEGPQQCAEFGHGDCICRLLSRMTRQNGVSRWTCRRDLPPPNPEVSQSTDDLLIRRFKRARIRVGCTVHHCSAQNSVVAMMPGDAGKAGILPRQRTVCGDIAAYCLASSVGDLLREPSSVMHAREQVLQMRQHAAAGLLNWLWSHHLDAASQLACAPAIAETMWLLVWGLGHPPDVLDRSMTLGNALWYGFCNYPAQLVARSYAFGERSAASVALAQHAGEEQRTN